MPRIRPSTFYQARAIHPYLSWLLPTCRDLTSARNELRWIEERARQVSKQLNTLNHRPLLHQFVLRRSHGEPLQYILQSEFFGDLEIKCKDGVLIPRQETAASVKHLAQKVQQHISQREVLKASEKLHVLDLCTGTGCIPLLFQYEFYKEETMSNIAMELVGVDISTRALSLARENLIHQIASQARTFSSDSQRMKSLHRIAFVHADVLRNEQNSDNQDTSTLTQALQRLKSEDGPPEYDILIANPPYISPKAFQHTTSPSVRKFEPKLALVPQRPPSEPDVKVGDYFYPHLFRIAKQINAKVAMFEVADIDQARRVAQMASEQGIWDVIEIWRDEPGVIQNVPACCELAGRRIDKVGTGHGRSVFVSREITR